MMCSSKKLILKCPLEIYGDYNSGVSIEALAWLRFVPGGDLDALRTHFKINSQDEPFQLQ